MIDLYKSMRKIIDDVLEGDHNDVCLARTRALEEIARYERELSRRSVVPIHVSILDGRARLPIYANQDDAGADISALMDTCFEPFETKIVRTGLAVAIPVGYELQIRPRSGMSLKTPFRVANAPGTIDSGYRDEIGVILHNTSDKPQKIEEGQRIAQFVLARVPQIQWEICTDVKDIGTNRGGGFGSSGR